MQGSHWQAYYRLPAGEMCKEASLRFRAITEQRMFMQIPTFHKVFGKNWGVSAINKSETLQTYKNSHQENIRISEFSMNYVQNKMAPV